ncbi:chemotaxis protein CheV [Mangrovitalea sediminis]|uniref:chemotaxis protein CheV n=1 Tax=Mangrovitalea sediminis TaxID=1982043 RepID=UPI000BE51F1E|nr:chemotaxis protein CheV [Mangrovitalea sediminis]
MSGVLDSVDQRTRLVGQNRLELLLFRLSGQQLFALNVFKVREVIKLPGLTEIPNRHPVVCGVTHVRDQTIPVINLSQAIRMKPQVVDKESTIIVTEYNRTVQAFLVGSVDRIINMNWEQIEPPPRSAGRAHYLTAITRYDNRLVEIIDVEKVLAEIVEFSTDVSEEIVDREVLEHLGDRKILLVDDSPVAINQARDTLSKIGISVMTARNGREGLALLKELSKDGKSIYDQVLMVVTDAEMPEMDGYRLTTEIRNDPQLKDLHVVLHTSLSGSFNKAMVKQVGCDDFLSKFRPDELAILVQDYLRGQAAD